MTSLYSMTSAQIDRAAERHFDRLLEEYEGGVELTCSNCRYYDGKQCTKYLEDLEQEEYDAMEESGDFSAADRDEDDYCDDHDFEDPKEDEYDRYESEREMELIASYEREPDEDYGW